MATHATGPCAKHVQWMDILSNPIPSEIIAKILTAKSSGISTFRTLSCACKLLYKKGGYLTSLVDAFHDPGLYPSRSYQNLVQLSPLKHASTCLGQTNFFQCDGNQSVKIMDHTKLVYDNGSTSTVRVCAPDHELTECALTRQARDITDARDRGNYIVFIEHRVRHQDFIRVLPPKPHDEVVELPLEPFDRYMAKQAHVFDLPDGPHLLIHYMRNGYVDEFINIFRLDEKSRDPKKVIVAPGNEIYKILALSQPSKPGESVFAFLVYNHTVQTNDRERMFLSIFNHNIMQREKNIILKPSTETVINLNNQFVCLLLRDTNNFYKIQALNTETREFGPKQTLHNLRFIAEVVDGEIKADHVTIQYHLPFDQGPLGRQVIAASCFKAVGYLARGLHFYPLWSSDLGLTTQMTNFTITHWKGEDGLMRVRFYMGDVEGFLYEYSP